MSSIAHQNTLSLPAIHAGRVESIVIKFHKEACQIDKLKQLQFIINSQPVGCCKIRLFEKKPPQATQTLHIKQRIYPSDSLITQISSIFPGATILATYRCTMDSRGLEDEIDPQSHKERLDKLFKIAEKRLSE